ncbi:MAG: histidinol-phosphate transaminase [Nitrospinota bacterium]|nr:histidinol-phosphate transaminase [Nitrospinota bacterium]
MNVADNIKSLVPYPPGKPIEELERELGISGSVKLASNENPLGPSPLAVEAIKKACGKINFYPDGGGFYLKEKLSGLLNVSPKNIILGNGSNEIIEILLRTFLGSGDDVVMADQAFIVYSLITKAAGGEVIAVPLIDYTHDLAGLEKAVTAKTRLIFIANPNNPTGTSVGESELRKMLDSVPKDILVVLDEAYCEYVGRDDYPDSVKLLEEHKNIVILRTFSKIYGLAGVRVGYGIGSEEVVDYMNRVRQPFNVNSLGQVAALAALSDEGHVRKSIESNNLGKKYLYTSFEEMGLSYVRTEGNFILVEVGNGVEVYNQLLKEGVIVRPMAGYKFPSHIRVTIGKIDENERFITSLKKVLNTATK